MARRSVVWPAGELLLRQGGVRDERFRMDQPTPRWRLWDTTTNSHGVTHHTLWCSALPADEDYEELVRVLKDHFGAADVSQLAGPYSVHHLLDVGGLRFGIILDDPADLDLY